MDKIKIPCHNTEDCPYKKYGKMGINENLTGWHCIKPDYPVPAPEFCLWRKLAEI
jgi:hypothetical protein